MDLRDRLRLALGTDASPAAAAAPPAWGPPRPALERHLPGAWLETALGPAFVLEERWPLDHAHGRLPLERVREVPGAALARLAGHASLARLDLARTVFLDVETTGLAGGTGTYVFLVGVGHLDGGSFRLRQYLLADLRHEPAMLDALAGFLAGFEGVVTYNGRAFDLPLIQTRLTLNRLPADLDRLLHLDLLPPARRFYRGRLPSCRLAEIERSVLSFFRRDDVPGWLVPSAYFRYLRTGDPSGLRGVVRHNALDILSLVALTAHLGGLLDGRTPDGPLDCLAAAAVEERDGYLDRAAALYRLALEHALPEPERAAVRQRLARLCRRLGRWEEAAEQWAALAFRPGNRDLGPLVELAKVYEHRLRRFDQAAAVVERALALVERHHALVAPRAAARHRADLEHRLARLRRRLAPTPA
ncbi:MAG TPA: ribonuclease H-like domain-containing protein [Dehalococcoidia bacterium]